MSVDYNLFLEWAKGYFGEEELVFAKGGNEICAPSPFAEDLKHHLWMNPSGGKSKHPENGSYRCWYTDKRGSLVTLVSELEGVGWDDAQEMICDQVSLRSLEMKVHELFGHKEEVVHVEQSNVGLIKLPPFTYQISNLTEGEIYETRSKSYLNSRKIPFEGLYVCTSGKYEDRVIIPYYDQNKALIWYNARTMSQNPNVVRYMKPDVKEEEGLSQENVLYIRTWPKKNQRLFIMEGEFDAISLDICGIRAAACGGKFLSPSQIELIRPYIPVLAFDTDKYGKRALTEVGDTLLQKGFTEVYYVRPPTKYKDWNKFLVSQNEELVRQYIEKYTKRFNTWTTDQLDLLDL